MEKKVTLRESVFRNAFYRALEELLAAALTNVPDVVVFYVDNELSPEAFHITERLVHAEISINFSRRI